LGPQGWASTLLLCHWQPALAVTWINSCMLSSTLCWVGLLLFWTPLQLHNITHGQLLAVLYAVLHAVLLHACKNCVLLFCFNYPLTAY
jgi:hypothetical protein